MSFDKFLDLFEDELTQEWKNSIHYISTDFGVFCERKYQSFIKTRKSI